MWSVSIFGMKIIEIIFESIHIFFRENCMPIKFSFFLFYTLKRHCFALVLDIADDWQTKQKNKNAKAKVKGKASDNNKEDMFP